MKVRFLFVGSHKGEYVDSGLQLFAKRLKRFSTVEIHCTKNLKGIKDPNEQSKLEAEQILKLTQPDEFMILLDEKGKKFGSLDFAKAIEQKKNQGNTKLCFVICGAHGAHSSLKERSQAIWSLSELTFSHQLARVILLEQVYRAFTIIHNHPYHNEG